MASVTTTVATIHTDNPLIWFLLTVGQILLVTVRGQCDIC
jgi:hypothetical protein